MKKFVFLSILFAVVAVTFIGLIEGGEEFEFEEKHKLAQCMGKGKILNTFGMFSRIGMKQNFITRFLSPLA